MCCGGAWPGTIISMHVGCVWSMTIEKKSMHGILCMVWDHTINAREIVYMV